MIFAARCHLEHAIPKGTVLRMLKLAAGFRFTIFRLTACGMGSAPKVPSAVAVLQREAFNVKFFNQNLE